MMKPVIAVLLICVSLGLVSCGSRELREEYYDSSTYGQGGMHHPWNDPLSRTLRP